MCAESTRLNQKDATLTGREYKTSDQFLLECQCPHCGGLQWHPPGKTECVYACARSFHVTNLKVVPFKQRAAVESGDSPGPEVA